MIDIADVGDICFSEIDDGLVVTVVGHGIQTFFLGSSGTM